MLFEWDQAKNRRNLIKHGVSFETAVLVFEDPHAVSILERAEHDAEERWRTIGWAGNVMLMLVVHVYREADDGEAIRIISARKATPRERAEYEEAH